MKASSPALILYIFSSIFYLLSIIFDYSDLILLFKPIIASSMLFYYLQECKGKVSFWYTLILILLFISGILNTFEDELVLVYVIIVNFFVYGILLTNTILSIFKLKIKLLDGVNVSYVIITSFFLMTLAYVSMFVVFNPTSDIYYFIVLYSITLLFLGIFNTIKFIANYSKANVYLMISTFCFIICDLFYALYYYYYDFIFFRYISILCNVINFYFLVSYFLEKPNKQSQ
ncbi:hypothetical protein [Flavobacterium sp.]|uniref:hypothetical protein n=1 Tax=Flavobacterium sp. TaxID=239 RepID=UPI00286C106A|nr:hypothetical protein [Flavobacterium sp.]